MLARVEYMREISSSLFPGDCCIQRGVCATRGAFLSIFANEVVLEFLRTFIFSRLTASIEPLFFLHFTIINC